MSDYSELDELREFDKPTVKKEKVINIMHDLNDPVGENGFKWWGQHKTIKTQATALFICPHCNETKRMQIYHIITNKTKSCGCIR